MEEETDISSQDFDPLWHSMLARRRSKNYDESDYTAAASKMPYLSELMAESQKRRKLGDPRLG